MPDDFRLPSPLYAIADTTQTEMRSIPALVERMIAAGVRIVQLRVKNPSAAEFFELARILRHVTSQSDCALVINDRVDIAVAVDADGVHLGQEDLPISAARPLTGQKIIGVSTHSLEQARTAEKEGADYIGFGPLFGTQTKDTGFAPRGVEMLARVRKAVRVPIVAIGGITLDNVSDAWQHGADSAAMISYLAGDDTQERVTKVLHRARTRGVDVSG